MHRQAENLQRATLEEFEAMEKDARFNYELIDGIVLMAPSPSAEHQDVGGNIYYHSKSRLRQSGCKPYYELDVKTNGEVYKPDILIRCKDDPELPKVVFEIISPSSRYDDLMVKLVKYGQIGISEYWIVDLKQKSVTVHDYVNHTAETYLLGDTIRSQAVPELVLSVTEIFEDVDQ